MKKLILSALIAGSLIAGTTVTSFAKGNDPVKKERKMQKVDNRVAILKTELGLRDEQVPQVKDALTKHREAVKSIKAKYTDKTDKTAKKTELKAENLSFKTKMQSILNEAQYRKFEQMVKDEKAAKNEKKKNKQKNGEGKGHEKGKHKHQHEAFEK